MIIGSGLLARAFGDKFISDPRVCIFASGVSNSQCTDAAAFERESCLLRDAVLQVSSDVLFVYFSTCSVADPAAARSPYVLHKLAMESLIANRARHLICRLPQVAGRTKNPHTLLNYLAACISKGQRFDLWSDASRNIIDVDDVVALVNVVINTGVGEAKILNLASPTNHTMMQIVSTMENVMQKKAVFEFVERGSSYCIDVRETLPLCIPAGVDFQNNYLDRVIRKYYGST